MNGNGHGSETKPSAQFFTKEQRQRVEALTVARALRPSVTVSDQIDMAVFGMVPVGVAPLLRLAGADDEDDEFLTIVRSID